MFLNQALVPRFTGRIEGTKESLPNKPPQGVPELFYSFNVLRSVCERDRICAEGRPHRCLEVRSIHHSCYFCFVN